VIENKVIIILGPTGVGKTEVSILIAKSLKTEIISADSMQIYKGMDIGTAKPTKTQLSQVKHHMISSVEPSELYSVGRYIQEVKQVINKLHKEGKIPIIVGGTGLYIKAMTKGLFIAPKADLELRKKLKELEQKKPGILYKKLKKLDPEKSKELFPTDLKRIIRSLEVIINTKKPISLLQKNYTLALPYQFIKIGLKRKRLELYKIIEDRVEKMFQQGLVNEVKTLLKKNPSEVCLQAIGYKEVIKYLKGEISLEETKKIIKQATKRYAKRQFTWFKKEDNVQWVDITGIYNPKDIFDKLIKETDLKFFI